MKLTRVRAWDDAWNLMAPVIPVGSQETLSAEQTQLGETLDELVKSPLSFNAIYAIANAVLTAWQIGQSVRVQPTDLKLTRSSVVALPLDLLDRVHRTLEYYANLTTYQAPRIGGVLAGCPRGDKPTAQELAREARQMSDELLAAITKASEPA